MYLLMRNKMIRVSAPIHGGSPVFNKHDSFGISTSIGKKGGGGGYQKGGGDYQNGYQKNLLIQKELYRCNGFPVVDDHIAKTTIYASKSNHSTPYKKSQSNGVAPFRTPNAPKTQHRFSPNPKSAYTTQRPLPPSNFNKDAAINQLNFGDKAAVEVPLQQQGGNIFAEAILFAGSKSGVTPSPTELPKPPQNWRSALLTTNRTKQQQQKPSAVVATTKSATPLDLTHHDSAVLLSIM